MYGIELMTGARPLPRRACFFSATQLCGCCILKHKCKACYMVAASGAAAGRGVFFACRGGNVKVVME